MSPEEVVLQAALARGYVSAPQLEDLRAEASAAGVGLLLSLILERTRCLRDQIASGRGPVKGLIMGLRLAVDDHEEAAQLLSRERPSLLRRPFKGQR
tara:strand:- start:48 stop:338 length:291 start_codon:yes stop_codon:yes gene_type:complete